MLPTLHEAQGQAHVHASGGDLYRGSDGPRTVTTWPMLAKKDTTESGDVNGVLEGFGLFDPMVSRWCPIFAKIEEEEGSGGRNRCFPSQKNFSS